jgi:hypothetical protein
MKKILMTSLFMLATLAWAAAQQPGSMGTGSTGQTTSSSSQAGASQQQPSTSGAAGQEAGQSGMPGGGSRGEMANPTVTEGCLGGSSPNYTITDASGTTYKLNIPPGTDASKLAAHVGESVNVAGNANSGSTPSIDVRGIGKGTGTCPPGAPSSAQPPKP